jgi:cellulose synthase/poly-beta-1,6-N-acetylglucosamine synthase-like glycosyltransferase
VVDDGSSDDTCAHVRARNDAYLLEQNHAGPAAARNLGARHARGAIVLFTDADCAPAEDWIERMDAGFRDGHLATQWGKGDLDREIVGVKGTYLSNQRELVARFIQLEYENKYERMARRMARDRAIDFVDTYSAGYRRDIFLANGGFETIFPVASVEDQELSFRLARRGHRMIFVPEAHVYHWGHARTVGAYWRKKFRIGYWKVLVHKRHPDKLWRDSHTPQVLKVQILLAALGLLCLLGSLFWRPLAWGAGIAALFFLLTTLPFVHKAWARDPWVALVSPVLLLVRALALGTGFLVGLLVHLPARGLVAGHGSN